MTLGQNKLAYQKVSWIKKNIMNFYRAIFVSHRTKFVITTIKILFASFMLLSGYIADHWSSGWKRWIADSSAFASCTWWSLLQPRTRQQLPAQENCQQQPIQMTMTGNCNPDLEANFDHLLGHQMWWQQWNCICLKTE